MRRVLGSNYNKVKNLVTNEVVAKYKNHVQKVAQQRNANGKFPTKKQLEKSKQLWVRLERNYGSLHKPPTPLPASHLAAMGVSFEEI